MSRQRREIRSTPATKTFRWGPGHRWQRLNCTACAGALERFFSAPIRQHGRAGANGGTAPGTPVATKSLYSGFRSVEFVWLVQLLIRQLNTVKVPHPFPRFLRKWMGIRCHCFLAGSIVQLVQLVQAVQIGRLVGQIRQDLRCGSTPFRASRHTAPGTPATYGSFPPHIPSLADFTRFHPTLPQDPTGIRRWAERYDGKRDLHLQHAA
jgi:hypothetical protein